MLDGEINEGDSFTFESLKLTVKKADERRIDRIEVEVLPKEEEDDDEEFRLFERKKEE